MNSQHIVALMLGSGGFGALFTAAVNAWQQRRTVRLDEFQKIVDALNARIDDLQEEVDKLKQDLNSERLAHEDTRRRFRIALRHIRAMLAWLGTDRTTEPPAVPRELLDEL